MSEVYQAYHLTIWAAAVAGLMLLLQLVVVDVAAIRAKHQPGTPIAVDADSFLFRASRAHANLNESIAALTLFAFVGVLSSAPAQWLGGFAWLFVAARTVHMTAYYANRPTPRSVAFAVSLIALVGMFATTAISWTAR